MKSNLFLLIATILMMFAVVTQEFPEEIELISEPTYTVDASSVSVRKYDLILHKKIELETRTEYEVYGSVEDAERFAEDNFNGKPILIKVLWSQEVVKDIVYKAK